MTKEKSIIKYNQTVQVSNGMSFLARKCWNILLSKFIRNVKSHRNMYQNSIYNYMIEQRLTAQELKENPKLINEFMNEMPLSDLMHDLDIKTNNIEYVKAVLKNLMQTTVEFNILDANGKKSWGATTLLSSCEIKDGMIKWEYSNYLINKLMLADHYTRIKLSIQKKMTNKYSLALYENCLKWYDRSKPVSYSPKISIDELRKLLVGDVKKYPIYKDFNMRIVNKAIRQVNKVSDLVITRKDFKELREVTHIQFFIKKRPYEPVKNEKMSDVDLNKSLSVKGLNYLRDELAKRGTIKPLNDL